MLSNFLYLGTSKGHCADTLDSDAPCNVSDSLQPRFVETVNLVPSYTLSKQHSQHQTLRLPQTVLPTALRRFLFEGEEATMFADSLLDETQAVRLNISYSLDSMESMFQQTPMRDCLALHIARHHPTLLSTLSIWSSAFSSTFIQQDLDDSSTLFSTSILR